MPVLKISLPLLILAVVTIVSAVTFFAVWFIGWYNKANYDGFYDEIEEIQGKIDKATTRAQFSDCVEAIQGLYTMFSATRFYPSIRKEVTELMARLERRQSSVLKK